MSDFKHRTPICEHCGAAYTPHTRECPKFGQPPPVFTPSEATMTNAAVARDCFMPSPQQPITMDTIRDAIRSMKKPPAPATSEELDRIARNAAVPGKPFSVVVDPPMRIEQTIGACDDPDRIWRATAKALDELFKGE